MVFSSIKFVFIFLPIVLTGYFLLKKTKWKNVYLLIASIVFYAMGGARHLPILLSIIVIDYFLARCIYVVKNGSHRYVLLICTIIINIGTLIYWKYLNLFIGTASSILGVSAEWVDIALPIGISFFVFQGLSFVIDVYRDKINHPLMTPEFPFKFLDFALYVSMFPQLIAGPIVRYSEIYKELAYRERFSRFTVSGIYRFSKGLAKKVVLADYLAIISSNVIDKGFGMITCAEAWVGMMAYTMQIYFDFSGYSDMAIGLGEILGFRFPDNFKNPYISKNITEFWRRWHISLSSWFRDYVYIPLGGSRRGNVYINLMVVFLLTGIWHGAEWGFLLWGIWHGVFVIIERCFTNHFKITPNRFLSLFSWLYTMLVVSIGWVQFATGSISKTLEYIKVLFGLKKYDYTRFDMNYILDKRSLFVLMAGTLLCIVVPMMKTTNVYMGIKNRIQTLNWICMPLSLILIVMSYIVMTNNGYSPFIYFRF